MSAERCETCFWWGRSLARPPNFAPCLALIPEAYSEYIRELRTASGETPSAEPEVFLMKQADAGKYCPTWKDRNEA